MADEIADLCPLVARLGDKMVQQHKRIAVAESCTGGGLAYVMTMVAGSSQWFEGGVVSYSNAVKIALLGVNESTLAEHGAVSEATAKEMVQGVLHTLKADYGIALTGIAGPENDYSNKPVGDVCFAWAMAGLMPITQHLNFIEDKPLDRQQIRIKAIRHAIIRAEHIFTTTG